MRWQVIFDNWERLLGGLWTTLELVALALVVGAALALVVAMARVSRNPLLAWTGRGYIFFFRGTPLLVQLFLIYYGLSQFTFVRSSMLWPILREPYWCAIIAFALNTSGYTAEILRGAIQAVPRGQIEAAQALGMSRALTFRRIIMPIAVRYGFPAYGNEVILMIKASALASTITILDLMGVTRTLISRTFAVTELFLAAGVIYLVITLVLTRVFALVERRLNRHLTGRG
ncbi:ABC transporter permease [Tistrella bauzanensis]|uniref:ABC transporter permease n=1 Tax=Tistrella bauzanensis TaxID=657419 RepID=A0ABQ1IBU6_9PROT|nr:ABC transporter permease [Tistrella bauzanensis]GGB33861.1 ABC transporter permease [Tistrella bauzanensis]